MGFLRFGFDPLMIDVPVNSALLVVSFCAASGKIGHHRHGNMDLTPYAVDAILGLWMSMLPKSSSTGSTAQKPRHAAETSPRGGSLLAPSMPWHNCGPSPQRPRRKRRT